MRNPHGLFVAKSMEYVLETLFDSHARVKLLRIFLQNPSQHFTFDEIVKRSRTRARETKKELSKLLKIGLLMKKNEAFQNEISGKNKKKRAKTFRQLVFYPDTELWIFPELRNLIIKGAAISPQKLVKKLRGLGNVKLGVISGSLYDNNGNSRTDLLIVGNNIKKSKLNKLLTGIESEIGKTIHYTLMDTSEFKYRMDMYDRFLRDILEYPHQKLINNLKV